MNEMNIVKSEFIPLENAEAAENNGLMKPTL